MDYKEKYLKYKNKYLALKSQMGGDPIFNKKYPVICKSYIRNFDDTAKMYTSILFCNCGKFVPSQNNKYMCTNCGHLEETHLIYNPQYNMNYKYNCEFTRSNKYCNCPGFLNNNTQITDDSLCILCDHAKHLHEIDRMIDIINTSCKLTCKK